MRTIFAFVAFAPILLAQGGAQSGGSISGRVTNSVTMAGIADVTLSACRSSPGAPSPAVPLPCWSVVSDDTGAFHASGIPEGQYVVMPAHKEGFFPILPRQPSIDISGDTRLDLQMTPLANLSGRVLDPEGDPARGVVVALDAPSCNGCTAVDVKITDDNGEFSFDHLPPNESLILSASPKFPADGKPDANSEDKIVTTYYPSAVELDQAVPVKSQGVDLFGYDIRLRTARARKLRGVVLDPDGNPVPRALVSIVKPAPGMVGTIRGVYLGGPQDVPVAEPTETRPDGTFVFPAVLEGEWTLRARSTIMPLGSGSREVSMSKSDVDNLEIRLAPPFEVEVTADWGDTPPAKPPSSLALLLPLDGPRIPPTFRGANLVNGVVELIEGNGFQGFAGRYFIGPPNALMPRYYAAAAMLDNRDVLGQVVEISGPASLKMIFKTGGSSVRGSVEKGGDATVVLMADATATGRIGYSGKCDANGAFLIPDLPPGEYTAVAVQGAVGDPLRPEFVSLLASNGKRVRIEAGSAEQVDLRVSK